MAISGNPPNDNGYLVTIYLKSGHVLNVVLKEFALEPGVKDDPRFGLDGLTWENESDDLPGLDFINPSDIVAIVSQKTHSFRLSWKNEWGPASKSGFEDL